MPTTSTLSQQTRRYRNDEIRSRSGVGADNLALEYGLSPITIRNILRGRDLNPPPSATRRRRRGASRTATRRPQGEGRKFGVELEFFGIPRRTVEAETRRVLGSSWRVKNDCSVTGEGLELVSPPLQGESGMEQLRKACQMLQRLGARVDRSCGLHVHHEARDLGASGLARIAEIYTANQDLINWLVAPSRRDGRWCKTLTSTELWDIRQTANSGRTPTATSRYRACNLGSYGRHGTVEFRQHQGTLNFRKIEAWTRLGQGLMDAALEDSTEPVNPAGGLRGLLSVVEDEDSAAFLIGRGVQLGATVVAVAS
jgi:hypothetical protein